MSDSVRPHRWQPTRLLHPWDSLAKNTGVGCHFLLRFMKVKSESEVTQSCPTLSDPLDCSPSGSSVHGISHERMLGCVAISSSRGSSQPRDQTCISCIVRQVLNHCTTREIPLSLSKKVNFKMSVYYISEKAMAPHSSTLAWRIPWTEEPGGLQSMWSLRVGHD